MIIKIKANEELFNKFHELGERLKKTWRHCSK